MPLKPMIVSCPTANLEVNSYVVPFRYLKLLSVTPVTANVKIKMLDSADPGSDYFALNLNARQMRSPGAPPIPKLYVKSDTINTVCTFLVGDVDWLVEDGAPVTIPGGTLPVAGAYNENTVYVPNRLGLIGVAMFNVNNQAEVLQSADSVNLNAQPVVPVAAVTSQNQSSTAAGVVFAANGVRFASALLQYQVAQAGATLTVKGIPAAISSSPVVVPIYDRFGNLVSDAGLITALGTYYIDVDAYESITVTTNAYGAGAVQYAVSASPYERIPAPNLSAVGFLTGQATVAVAGTAQVLGGNVPIVRGRDLVVRALVTNTGNIWVGNSAVNAQNHAVAFLLKPGESISLQLNNINLVFIDAAVNGEGAVFAMEN